MVSDLNRSKNYSKMKSPKSNGRSRRNKLSLSKDQQMKNPKKEQQARSNEIDTTNRKIKSGSWKRTTCQWNLPCSSNLSKTNEINEITYPPLPPKSKPAILYSDVLFSGEKLKTPVKIKNLTPRHSVKINSRSRKRLISVERKPQNQSKEKCNLRMMNSLKPVETPSNKNIPKSATELGECINKLMNRLNIKIPQWNFDDCGVFNDSPEFICRFDDYNYLACENVALVGLRLASDGKFRF